MSSLIFLTDASAFVPRALEVFTYDDDGNLNSDGRCIYTWDVESLSRWVLIGDE